VFFKSEKNNEKQFRFIKRRRRRAEQSLGRENRGKIKEKKHSKKTNEQETAPF